MCKQMTCLLWAFLLSATLYARQDQGQKPSTPDVPTKPTRPAPTQPTESQEDRQPRVLFITGSIIMADNTEVPQSIRVELLCNGRTFQQSHVAPNGNFSFELGNQRMRSMPDASVSDWGGNMPGMGTAANDPFGSMGNPGLTTAGLGRVDLNGCSIRIPPMPGFHSNEVPLRSRSVFDNPDIGQILLYRLDTTQGSTISFLSLSAPSKARKSFQKAGKELSKKDPDYDKAVGHLEKSVEVYPEYAEAWNMLGNVLLARNDEAGAREAFQKSISADGKYLEPYLSLARLELERQRWAEASEFTQRLVDLNPHIPKSHYFHGLASYYLGDLDSAEASFSRLEDEKDFEYHPRTFLFLGMIHARQGKIGEAADELNNYLKIENPARVSPQLRAQLQKQLQDWQSQGLVPEK